MNRVGSLRQHAQALLRVAETSRGEDRAFRRTRRTTDPGAQRPLTLRCISGASALSALFRVPRITAGYPRYPTLVGLINQQPSPAVEELEFVPVACSPAVGCPCSCRCASSDEVALPCVALFIAAIGGCCDGGLPVAPVCALAPTVGPEPASFVQGPA